MSKGKFNPRALPNRAHYDRVMTVAAQIIGSNAERTASIQTALTEDAAEKVKAGEDDFEIVQALLAEVGFAAVIDHMADIIETAQQEGGPA